MTRVLGLVIALLVAALLGATDGAAVQAQNPKLFGSVGQGIVLRDAQGNRVTKLDPGTYDIEVELECAPNAFEEGRVEFAEPARLGRGRLARMEQCM